MADETELFPVLYILMRNDLTSMNAGKAMAQASHASNAFAKDANSRAPEFNLGRLFPKWERETTQGFGTVLVLSVNETEMRTAVDVAQKLDLVANVVHDPTYPILDGDTVHHIPLDTCAYVFMDKNSHLGQLVVKNFPLHP